MATRQAHAVGIPIVRTLALVGPVLQRLLRWWLVWIVFVVVVWALMPPLLRFADIAVADGMPNGSTVLPIDRSDDPPFQTSPWCKTSATPKAVADVVHREVDIDLRGGAASANLSAQFDVCGARLEQVVETMADPGADVAGTRERVTGLVFGYFNLGGGERRSAPLRVEAGVDTPTATINGTFVETVPALPKAASSRQVFVTPSAWTAATTHVRIRFDQGTGVWSSGAAPLRQDDGVIEWVLSGSNAFVSATVEPSTTVPGPSASTRSPASVAASADAGVAARPTSTGSLLLRLLAGQIGGLRSVWLGITLAVPFLLLGSWASRVPRAGAGVPAAGDALIDSLHEGCVVAGGVIAVLVMLEFAETVAAGFEWLPNRVQLFNLGWSAAICKTALVASAWIGFGTWRPAAPARGALPLAACGLVVAIGGWLIDPANLALVMRRTSFAAPVSSQAAVALGIETVGALLAAAAIAVASFRWSIAARGALVLVVTAMVVAVADHAQIRAHLPVLAALFALPFGWAFASVSRVWVPGMPRPPRWTLLLGALGAAVLALPPDQERNWSQAWLVGATAWALVRWWQLPALVLLVLWFARADTSPAARRSAPASIDAAAVFLFVLFFWNAQLPLLPLVVEAAVGAAILRWGLFVARPLPAPTRRRRLVSKTVDDLRSFNALTRLRRGLRKALDDKLAKGELDAQEWLDRADRNDRVIRRRVAMAARGKLRAMLALNVGPRGTAWQRGVQGALVTTMIALPWIATYVAHTSFETRYPTNAATLSQLGVLLFALLRWPALGFFFLYFYPMIRGVNGIQKGLVLAAGLIVPSAAATLVSTSIASSAWTAFALWSLQVFICCMSVGVGLGDLGALRKVGKGPRALVEIYDLGTLTAWFTSLAIAVGAAATTAIASGAGAVLTVGLKLLIPEAQTTAAGPH